MVIDIQFLHGCKLPTVAVLYQDTKEARHFKTYQVLLKDKVRAAVARGALKSGSRGRSPEAGALSMDRRWSRHWRTRKSRVLAPEPDWR